ncbi:hypothetical protein [Escherichia coli]|uniref:hypothetical protein n=1 Tax=Escherichia coli TaxID=562 RepID=UPI0030F4AFBA
MDAWQKAYRYYRPLKGQDVDGVVSLPRTGKGSPSAGVKVSRPWGVHPATVSFHSAIQELSESLIRNRKNEVGNAFLKLVQDNPTRITGRYSLMTDRYMRVIAERKDRNW